MKEFSSSTNTQFIQSNRQRIVLSQLIIHVPEIFLTTLQFMKESTNFWSFKIFYTILPLTLQFVLALIRVQAVFLEAVLFVSLYFTILAIL